MESITHKLGTNQTWFDAYFRTNMVNYEAPWVCDAMCRMVQTCAINHVDYSQYAYCVDQAALHHGVRETKVNGASKNGLKIVNVVLMLMLFF